MIPMTNNGRLLLLVETTSNLQVRTSRAVTVCKHGCDILDSRVLHRDQRSPI